MTALPSFLQKGDSTERTNVPVNALHQSSMGRSRCLWWPCRDASADPSTILLMIPGAFQQPSAAFRVSLDDHDRESWALHVL